MNIYNLSNVSNYGAIVSGVENVKSYQNEVVPQLLNKIVINNKQVGSEVYALDKYSSDHGDISFNSEDLYNAYVAVRNDSDKIQDLLIHIINQISANGDSIVELNLAIMNNYEKMDATDDDAVKAALESQNAQIRVLIDQLKKDNEILQSTHDSFQKDYDARIPLLVEIKNEIEVHDGVVADVSRLFRSTFYDFDFIYDADGKVSGTEGHYYNDNYQLTEIVRSEMEDGRFSKRSYYRGNNALASDITYKYDDDGNIASSRRNEYDLDERLIKTTVDIAGKADYYITYEYDEDNNLLYERIFDATDDKKSTEILYNEDGSINSVSNYKKDGFLESVSYKNEAGKTTNTDRYDNGKLASSTTYDSDRNISNVETFDDSGNVINDSNTVEISSTDAASDVSTDSVSVDEGSTDSGSSEDAGLQMNGGR